MIMGTLYADCRHCGNSCLQWFLLIIFPCLQWRINSCFKGSICLLCKYSFKYNYLLCLAEQLPESPMKWMFRNNLKLHRWARDAAKYFYSEYASEKWLQWHDTRAFHNDPKFLIWRAQARALDGDLSIVLSSRLISSFRSFNRERRVRFQGLRQTSVVYSDPTKLGSRWMPNGNRTQSKDTVRAVSM